jgi:hypothetical protein
MTDQLVTGGILPADPLEFLTLLKQSRPVPKRTRREIDREELKIQEYNRDVELALRDRSKRYRLDAIKTELRDYLNVLIYDDVVAETQRAVGSENTWAAYRSVWNKFQNFCDDHGFPSLPSCPEIVATYIIYAARDAKPQMLQRVISAIKYFHAFNDTPIDMDDVQVRGAVRWVTRQAGEAKERESELVEEKQEPTINGSGRPN